MNNVEKVKVSIGIFNKDLQSKVEEIIRDLNVNSGTWSANNRIEFFTKVECSLEIANKLKDKLRKLDSKIICDIKPL